MDKLTSLANITDAIFRCEATWEDKYDAIFSEGLSKKAFKEGLVYYDPDTSYEEDVRAFHEAIMEVTAKDGPSIQITWRELVDRFSENIDAAGYNSYAMAEGLAEEHDVINATWLEARILGMTKHEFDARIKK